MPKPSLSKLYITLFPFRMSEIELRLNLRIADFISSYIKVAKHLLLYLFDVF